MQVGDRPTEKPKSLEGAVNGFPEWTRRRRNGSPKTLCTKINVPAALNVTQARRIEPLHKRMYHHWYGPRGQREKESALTQHYLDRHTYNNETMPMTLELLKFWFRF